MIGSLLPDGGTTTPTAGEQPNHWHEDWQCAHCGTQITIRATAPWPMQCWSCRAYSPRLVMRGA